MKKHILFSQKGYLPFNFSWLLPVLLTWLLSGCQGVPIPEKTPTSIIVEADISSKYFYRPLQELFFVRDMISIHYTPFHYYATDPPTQDASAKVINGKVTWILNVDHPVKVAPPFGPVVILHPGDSVHIQYMADQPAYSGNKTASFALLNALLSETDRNVKPRKRSSHNARTLEDYQEWNEYLNKELERQLPIVETYQTQLSQEEYTFYKANVISKIENDRVKAFNALSDTVKKGYPGVSMARLTAIWDSTQYTPARQWLQSNSEYYGSIYDYFSFIQTEVIVKQFNFSKDSLSNHEIFTRSIYINAKDNYKGLIRERLLAFILDEQSLTEMGLKNPTTQALLKDYYNQPGYPEYKAHVKELEKKREQREIELEKKKKDKEKKAKPAAEQVEEKQAA